MTVPRYSTREMLGFQSSFQKHFPFPHKKRTKRERFCLCILTGDAVSLTKRMCSVQPSWAPSPRRGPGLLALAWAVGLGARRLECPAVGIGTRQLPGSGTRAVLLCVSSPWPCSLPPVLFCLCWVFTGLPSLLKLVPLAIRWSSWMPCWFLGRVAPPEAQ